MRHLVTFFWSLILGQIIAYLGAALNHGTYSFIQGLLGSVVITVVVVLIGELSQPAKKTSK